jgi:hypothetical protein
MNSLCSICSEPNMAFNRKHKHQTFNWKDCVVKMITRWFRICKFVNISPLDVPCISRGIENTSPLCFYTMIVSQWPISLATVQVRHVIPKLQHFDIHCNPSAFSCGSTRIARCHSVWRVEPTRGLNAAVWIVPPALGWWHLCVWERNKQCVRESTNNNAMPIPDKKHVLLASSTGR